MASQFKVILTHPEINFFDDIIDVNWGQVISDVIDQNIILTVLIHNLKTAWPTKILMPFLSPLDNLIWDACIIFRKGVDNFEIAHKTW